MINDYIHKIKIILLILISFKFSIKIGNVTKKYFIDIKIFTKYEKDLKNWIDHHAGLFGLKSLYVIVDKEKDFFEINKKYSEYLSRGLNIIKQKNKSSINDTINEYAGDKVFLIYTTENKFIYYNNNGSDEYNLTKIYRDLKRNYIEHPSKFLSSENKDVRNNTKISFKEKPENLMDFNTNVPNDIIAITSYFNPAGYKTKKENFIKFRNHLRSQGVPLLVVECSFLDKDYELSTDDADIMIRVKSGSKVWQKERLLNIAIENIPTQYTKFCSLDFDIIFNNNLWAKETSELLDKHLIVQPFENTYRFRKNEYFMSTPYDFGSYEGQLEKSFAKGVIDFNNNQPRYWLEAGHPGFAWAFRKDSFNEFYDKLIIGGADIFMANSFYGFSKGIEDLGDKMFLDQYQYKNKISSKINGNVGYAQGSLFHLWHGTIKNRQYNKRYDLLKNIKLDPDKDFKKNKYGCWELEESIKNITESYFLSRKETGTHKINFIDRIKNIIQITKLPKK